MRSTREPILGLQFCGQWKSGKKLHRLPRHRNPGLEIVHVSRGQLRWEVEGREYRLGAGMLFFTLPWQVHGGVEEVQPSSEISFFCVKLAKPAVKPCARFGFHPVFRFSGEEERIISSRLIRSRAHALPADERTGELFRYLFEVARAEGPLRESRVREIIKLLILDLAGRTKSGSAPAMLETEERVRRLVRVLETRYAEPWTLESMCAACGLGRSQFADLLKKQVGDTPVTFLNRLRVRRAQELLCESGKSITEIAYEVGFNSSQYFATVFKQFTDREARSFRVVKRPRSC
jgi:AraC family L-rhamnose operon regulatory protein RhaS